jgi:PAS domain-containing protein
MIGRSAVDFIHQDDLEATRNEMRCARRGQQMRNFATRYVHKDGRAVTLGWTGVWSEPEYYFIGRDMTESKKAEEALRDSEQMARGIIDTALHAFVQMDAAGNVVEWNSRAEAVFGWSREEAVGPELGHDDDSRGPSRGACGRTRAIPAHRRSGDSGQAPGTGGEPQGWESNQSRARRG